MKPFTPSMEMLIKRYSEFVRNVTFRGSYKLKKRIVIIGGGPSGLFAARELSKNPNASVTIIDKAPRIGGSGLKSDGKLNFTYKEIGVEDLTLFISQEEAEEIIQDMKLFFEERNVFPIAPDKDKIKRFKMLCILYDLTYIPVEQAHIGSDRLALIMRDFYQVLMKKNIKFRLNTEVLDINEESVTTEREKISYDYLFIAVGRTGSLYFKDIYDKLGIKYDYSPLDIGVRVEVPKFSTEKLIEEYGLWDPKIIGFTDQGSKFRNFCTCPYGYVSLEHYGKFNNINLIGVNGYSDADKRSKNSNFGFMTTVNLTEPFEDTTLLGQITAHKTNLLGGGKPIVQRYVDFIEGRRSNEERINEVPFKSTLPKNLSVPGDINFAYDGKVIYNLKRGLARLGQIIHLPPKATLLYAPEIKFYARKIKFKENFRTEVENIYIIGDGSGISRGIIGAGATGIIAARDI